jgi:hypothetical protein
LDQNEKNIKLFWHTSKYIVGNLVRGLMEFQIKHVAEQLEA